MAKRLSSVLVEKGMVDIATMERAFRHKDREGGRLGTNLLEIDVLDEDKLQEGLSLSRELPSPPARLLEAIDPTAVHYLDVDEAANFGVIPLATWGAELLVAVKDPMEPQREDLLCKRTGHRLRPHIIPEFRFQHLLSLLYGLPLSQRIQQLVARFPRRIGLTSAIAAEEEADTAEMQAVAERQPEVPVTGAAEPQAEEMAGVPTAQAEVAPVALVPPFTAPSEEPAAVEPGEPAVAPGPVEVVAQPQEPVEPVETRPEVWPPGSQPVPIGPEAGPAVFPSAVEMGLPVEATRQPATEEEPAFGEAAPVEAAPSVSMELPRDLDTLGQAWTEDQLGAFLQGCQDRDLILQALLGFIQNYCPRSCLLTVHKGQLKGYTQKGLSTSTDLIRSIRFEAAPVLAKVQGTWGSTTAIDTPHDLGLVSLYRAHGVSVPPEVVVGVIQIRRRPVLIWTADSEGHPVPRTAIPHLERATGQVAHALARLVFQQKRSGQTGHQQPRLIEVAATVPSVPSRVLEREGKKGPLEPADGGSSRSPVDSGSRRSDTETPASVVDTSPGIATRRFDAPPKGIAATSAAPLVPPSPFTPEEARHIQERPLFREGSGAGSSSTALGRAEELPGMFVGSEAGADQVREGQDRVPVERPPNKLVFGDLDSFDLGLGDEEPSRGYPEGETAAAGMLESAFPDPGSLLDALQSEEEGEVLRAKAEVLLAEEEVLDELQARFPGPVLAEPGLPNSPLFASQYGPLLAVVVELGPGFADRLIDLMRSKWREQRLYATLCAQDLRYSKFFHPLIERLFDSDPIIRKMACDALDGYRRHGQFQDVFVALRKALAESNVNQQTAAAEAIGVLFDEESIPILIDLVDNRSVRVASAAQAALERMVFQSFGSQKSRWLRWYQRNGMQSRDEWLLEGVAHRDERIRTLASEFIRHTPTLNLQFDPLGGRREVRRVQEALRRRIASGQLGSG
ncbi:MAG: HEAT repeat domain-containing protein [Bradymonadales bacterium]|nr:HEAT repeat domain-containing protein [Bradymonadales bacterium]